MIEQALSKVVTRRPLAHAVAGLLLLTFVALGVTSLLEKCATSDEVVHLLAGYTYWELGDYRVDPENGNLPQRWMALPLLWGDFKLPAPSEFAQRDQWGLAQLFFYEAGNDPRAMLMAGRAAMAVLAVVLGIVVYAWSAHLYGRGGGLLSLALYSFSTAMLANGCLMTSDLTASLCFLISVGAVWRMLERVTPWRVAGSAAAMGLLFVAKMSAPLVVVIGSALMALWLVSGRGLIIEAGGVSRQISDWRRQVAVMSALVALHAVAVVLVIWTFYGYRFSAISPSMAGQEQLTANWNAVLEDPLPLRAAIVAARENRWLPEAYLYGQAYVLKYSQKRWAFLDGRYSEDGWWWFFPYCFLLKTSAWLFIVIGLAISAAASSRRPPPRKRKVESALRVGLYRTAPLWVLLCVYWAMAITSNINIGHRHILVTYPALFILCGGAAWWFEKGRKSASAWLLGVSLLAYAAEAIWAWPNYLAYFNPLAGGSAQGYRRLVDSSLDWGQDLPGLKRWLESRGLNDPSGTPVYLSYFGTGSPTWHGIKAQRLPGYIDIDLREARPVVELRGGYYCVSASMLAMVLSEPRGPWSTFYEQHYQQALADFRRFAAMPPGEQQELARTHAEEVSGIVNRFDALRLGRLMAYLRHRQPDDDVGHSILIYKLSDAEVESALYGAAAEMVTAHAPL